ncbi:MAG: 4-hydroxy-3-methylbut-2-enyl diphosphate reductase [Lachnospiraceae bacterium]|nr:4-hydroxy-3-methylbut-2-enyl diphosphate reductase [Lachnospiraceae bacterium]
MEVRIAKTAGFCFGVERAVNSVYEQIEKGGKIYTYGPIIHNESVVEDLEKKGVKVIHSPEELKGVTEGTVIIRSHGVEKEIYEILEKQGISYVDATCPFVKKIHKIVEKASSEGDGIIIVGNPAHPEVEGICSYAGEKCYVVESVEEAEGLNLPKDTKYTIVSQTTFNSTKFKDIVDIFDKKGYYSSVVNTICNATAERQTEAKTIAAEVDAMLVIGGSHSSNSRKLFEICSKECDLTFFIQTKDDLNSVKLPDSVELVGITAGASTPKNIIEEVQKHVRTDF